MLAEQIERYRSGSLWKVEGALCEDGGQRVATATAHAEKITFRGRRVGNRRGLALDIAALGIFGSEPWTDCQLDLAAHLRPLGYFNLER